MLRKCYACEKFQKASRNYSYLAGERLQRTPSRQWGTDAESLHSTSECYSRTCWGQYICWTLTSPILTCLNVFCSQFSNCSSSSFGSQKIYRSLISQQVNSDIITQGFFFLPGPHLRKFLKSIKIHLFKQRVSPLFLFANLIKPPTPFFLE